MVSMVLQTDVGVRVAKDVLFEDNGGSVFTEVSEPIDTLRRPVEVTVAGFVGLVSFTFAEYNGQ